MILSARVKNAVESITLEVNEKIQKLTDEGRYVYNLTSGQLPFKPQVPFIESLKKQINFLKSYQYSPVSGFPDLKNKIIDEYAKKRNVDLRKEEFHYDCVISNGSKHSIYNVLGALVDPGDEVIILTPYWVSYPEMIKFWSGVPVIIESRAFDAYTPDIDNIRKMISPRTKAIIINSPNNPAGISYQDNWMKEFSLFLEENPSLFVISDEVYSDISYFDPKPTYFYQHNEKLLEQTIIISGISKSLASTGLRIGYTLAHEKIIKAITKLQSQTTSGANSLVQRALVEFDFSQIEPYLVPLKDQLRDSSRILREEFRSAGFPEAWYQTNSAFYYLLDFSRTPYFEERYGQTSEDKAYEICSDILNEIGVAMVPGSMFGYKNSARLSLVLELAPFEEAIKRLTAFLSNKKRE